MDDLEVAVAAARAGAAIVAEAFGGFVAPDYKARFDPVTEVDRRSEGEIARTINEHRPGDGLLAEEGSGTSIEGRRWIVDPLDGTVNFLHQIPHLAVSIALYEGDAPLVGVILDPLRDELFCAARGEGATLNGSAIAVSATTDMAEAVVATGFPYDHGQYATGYAVALGAVLGQVNGIRRFGSAALDLAWVAAGRYDGYWELGVAPWDQAAGILLVRESGGRATEPWGLDSWPESPLIVASNGRLHDRLRTLVVNAMPEHLGRKEG